MVHQAVFGISVTAFVFPAIAVQEPCAGSAADQAAIFDRDKGFAKPGVLQKDGEGVERDRL